MVTDLVIYVEGGNIQGIKARPHFNGWPPRVTVVDKDNVAAGDEPPELPEDIEKWPGIY